jgi:ubiquinone biosynthesis monooxygenase Coq7
MVLGSETACKRERAVPKAINRAPPIGSGAQHTYNAAMRAAIGSWDPLIAIADQGLRTVAAAPAARRRSPAAIVADAPLSAEEKARSAALMRVNRAGEIAAQALYLGQALLSRTSATRRQLLDAAADECDHLAWCTERLAELGGRTSRLDPLWYAGCVGLGMLAGAVGDRASLGFVGETETQVEAHLDDHLARLPKTDAKSRAILVQMATDEARHGAAAKRAGGNDLPALVRRLMALGGGFLRQVALIL